MARGNGVHFVPSEGRMMTNAAPLRLAVLERQAGRLVDETMISMPDTPANQQRILNPRKPETRDWVSSVPIVGIRLLASGAISGPLPSVLSRREETRQTLLRSMAFHAEYCDVLRAIAFLHLFPVMWSCGGPSDCVYSSSMEHASARLTSARGNVWAKEITL